MNLKGLLPSKQYTESFWTPFTMDIPGEPVLCNFGSDSQIREDAPLCIIPTQDTDSVKDPANTLEKPNVMTHWIDLLTGAGAKILLMHGRYFDNLTELSDNLKSGIDQFELWQKRVDGVIDYVIDHKLNQKGKTVFMGSSRHGFGVLAGTSRNLKIDAAVVIGPVIWWPSLKECAGMDNNPLILKNDIFKLVENIPPRPLQVQLGYADVRIGQHNNDRLSQILSSIYRSKNIEQNFQNTSMEIPGHSGGPPMHINETVITFLRKTGFLKENNA